METPGEKSHNSSQALPFIVKLYQILSTPACRPFIAWGPLKDTILVIDEDAFSKNVLPKYYKHANFGSFARQLNIYGFRKVGDGEFKHELFRQSTPHLLCQIKRRPSKKKVPRAPSVRCIMEGVKRSQALASASATPSDTPYGSGFSDASPCSSVVGADAFASSAAVNQLDMPSLEGDDDIAAMQCADSMDGMLADPLDDVLQGAPCPPAAGAAVAICDVESPRAACTLAPPPCSAALPGPVQHHASAEPAFQRQLQHIQREVLCNQQHQQHLHKLQTLWLQHNTSSSSEPSEVKQLVELNTVLAGEINRLQRAFESTQASFGVTIDLLAKSLKDQESMRTRLDTMQQELLDCRATVAVLTATGFPSSSSTPVSSAEMGQCLQSSSMNVTASDLMAQIQEDLSTSSYKLDASSDSVFNFFSTLGSN